MLQQVKNFTKKYVLSILLSSGKKNCSAMSSEMNYSHSSLYRYFDVFPEKEQSIKEFLINLVHMHATEENKGVIITDCTHLLKRYGKGLDILCYDFNSSIKNVAKGLSCVALAWTNGKVVIPLDFDFWIRRGDIEKGRTYKKKNRN